MCKNWILAQTEYNARAQAISIQEWWKTGCILEENVNAMSRWFAWWEKRILHWGSFNQVEDIYFFLKIDLNKDCLNCYYG